MMLYTKHESSMPCSFRREDFFKLHFEKLFFDPVTSLSNQSEPCIHVYSIILMSSTKVIQIMPLGTKVTPPRGQNFTLNYTIRENFK